VGAVFPGSPGFPLAFYPNGLTGWVAVERSGVGQYCLTPDPAITFNNSVLILTVGSPGATSQGSALWTGYCSINPFKFQVETLTPAGALTDNVNFTAMVP